MSISMKHEKDILLDLADLVQQQLLKSCKKLKLDDEQTDLLNSEVGMVFDLLPWYFISEHAVFRNELPTDKEIDQEFPLNEEEEEDEAMREIQEIENQIALDKRAGAKWLRDKLKAGIFSHIAPADLDKHKNNLKITGDAVDKLLKS